MAGRGRAEKVWDLFVLDGGFALDLVGQAPDAGAQDDACAGSALPTRADGGNSFVDLCGKLEHGRMIQRDCRAV